MSDHCTYFSIANSDASVICSKLDPRVKRFDPELEVEVMRLINVRTRKFESFDGSKVGHYAILSHTWIDGNEVSLQEWTENPSETTKAKSGYSKIVRCCEKASEDGYLYAWIDTCCIDKTSSAELSEAINSMFRWYSEADICYAYLEDVPRGDDGQEPDISASRWFTRGWTLQELIAPQHMEFLAADWSSLGFKADLFDRISSSSHIQKEYLVKKDHFRTASIAKRMSWVASRETTRIEDMAYCLLGMFDVNMPMIYGEGTKAFRRLQEEIIKLYPEDHSIYAWGLNHQPRDESTENMGADSRQPYGPAVGPLLGLLAESPRQFSQSGGVAPVSWVGRFYRSWRDSRLSAALPVSLGKTIKIDLPVLSAKRWSTYPWAVSPELQKRRAVDSILLCTVSDSERLILLPLVSWGDGYFGRLDKIDTKYGIDIKKKDPSDLFPLHQTLHVAAEESTIEPSPYDIIIRDLEVLERNRLSLWSCVVDDKFSLERGTIVRVHDQQEGVFIAFNFKYDGSYHGGFSVVLGRKRLESNKLPVCYIYFSEERHSFDRIDLNSDVTMKGCHFFDSERCIPANSPVPGVIVYIRLQRVMQTRSDQSNAIDKECFVDVIDLGVEEKYWTGEKDEKRTHVTGTIQKTVEGSHRLEYSDPEDINFDEGNQILFYRQYTKY